MSTAEGYTIDVYCDGQDCSASYQGFYGRDRAAADREAREKGWTIRQEPAPAGSVAGGRLAYCPKCLRRLIHLPGQPQCGAGLGRRGRCPNAATQAFKASRVRGVSAVLLRCELHPLLGNAVRLTAWTPEKQGA